MTDKFLIHQSIQSGNTAICQNLINENPDLNLIQDDDGRYPIHWAVSMSNLAVVKSLIDKQNINIDELKDNSGWTALHIAASIGNEDIFEYIMKAKPTPNVNEKTDQGTTPLHLAISKMNLLIANDLITEYKCKVIIKDKKGYTPLHRAASIGLGSIIKLLNDHHVNLNSQDNDGWTSLHHALAEGKGDAAKLLLELGASDEIPNNEGQLPIQVCVDEKIKKFVFSK